MKLIKFLVMVGMLHTANAQVVINEFMASNTTYIKDNAGEYDDWIELYNKSNVPVDISSWYLSDSIGDLKKWKFKKGTVIPAYGYFTFWADEDSAQGSNIHTNFKLSSLGEMIVIVDSLKNIVDSVTYGVQVTDKSTSRIPNGTGPFVKSTPTFGANNGGSSAISHTAESFVWKYDPAQKVVSGTGLLETKQNYIIVNAQGKIVRRGQVNTDKIDVDGFVSGVYYLRTNTTNFSFIVAE